MLTSYVLNPTDIPMLLKFKTQPIGKKGALYTDNMLTSYTSDYQSLLTNEL